MNRALPTRDRGNRSGAARRDSRPSGSMSSAFGLVGGVAHSRSGTETRKAAGVESGGGKRADFIASSFDRVGSLSIVSLRRNDRKPHLLTDRARQKPTHRMRLPPGHLRQFLAGNAAWPFQKIQHHGCFATLPRTLALCRALWAFLRWSGLLPRGSALRRNVGPLWPVGYRGVGHRNLRLDCMRGDCGKALSGFPDALYCGVAVLELLNLFRSGQAIPDGTTPEMPEPVPRRVCS